MPARPWDVLATAAAQRYGTPCYLFSWPHVLQALRELQEIRCSVPVRHWLSFKTQPVRRLVSEWRSLVGTIEVVSAFELQAALAEGYAPENILVNGVGKTAWLAPAPVPGLRVHFDSLGEVSALKTLAAESDWRVGLRAAVAGQYDPDEPRFGSQFGLIEAELSSAVQELEAAEVDIQGIHFHLRSNLAVPGDYDQALKDLVRVCTAVQLNPSYVDCGGGLPCPGDDIRAKPVAWSTRSVGRALDALVNELPSVKEVWFENGRFLTGRAGVLVLRVIDMKERPECRYLICDGGRTNHAIASDWELHEVVTVPRRGGSLRLTTVCGPTCMAFDRLCRIELPESVAVGDLILWMNAGAYHVPWETRFSHGLARIVWIDEGGEMSIARPAEQFSEWWGRQSV